MGTKGEMPVTREIGPLNSMTGFGHAQVAHGDLVLSCELSSLNHRYFDLNYYAPPFLMKFEAIVRQRVQSKVSRGRLRLNLHFTGAVDPGHRLQYCEENVREYLRAWQGIRDLTGVHTNVDPCAILSAPHILVPTREEFDAAEWQPVLEEVVDACVEKLNKMRRQEGLRLAEDLAARLDNLMAIITEVEERAPQVKEVYRGRILERLKEWELDAKIPEERMQAELFLFCERSDITEETVRTRSHIQQFQESLEKGGQIGRRLVFISQEINREATTIGAKSNDTEIGRNVVLFKEELAKIREQIENIE